MMKGSYGPAAPSRGIRATTGRRGGATAGTGAFTIIEAVISTIIVAAMLVAALNTVGASRLTQHKASVANRGRLLAESLMAEILRRDYQDPYKPVVFGPEADESTTTRADFDDVDDYHNWSSSPPIAEDGTALANATGWRRSVTVEWVVPKEPSQAAASESYAKRVTVTATYSNVRQAILVAVRTYHQNQGELLIK
jgi:type II secretory pathway pseudopilin PulG